MKGIVYLSILADKLRAERDEARCIAERQRMQIRRLKLELTMRPDPKHRTRRLAQFSPERRKRYLANIASLGTCDVAELVKDINHGS